MGLMSFLGRFLFASFFISSALLTVRRFVTDAELIGEEYAAKMASLLDLMVWSSEENKLAFVFCFLTIFAWLKVIGGLLLIFGWQLLSVLVLGLYLLMALPMVCGFYHYEVGEPKFILLLQDFVQNLSFIGALILFVELKFEISKMRQLKKKAGKSKRLRNEGKIAGK